MRMEFNTTINNNYIKIPNYEKLKGHKVKVILIDNTDTILDNKKDFDFIEYFSNNPIELAEDVKYLSREEANER